MIRLMQARLPRLLDPIPKHPELPIADERITKRQAINRRGCKLLKACVEQLAVQIEKEKTTSTTKGEK